MKKINKNLNLFKQRYQITSTSFTTIAVLVCIGCGCWGGVIILQHGGILVRNFRILIEKLKEGMSQAEGAELSSEDKRLLNILEIKIYDLSQNVEILTKQLTNNQIKDVVAQSYNIFGQLRQIFDKMGVKFLYEIMKKMQINSVLICSILTEKLDLKSESQIPAKKDTEVKIGPLDTIEEIEQTQTNIFGRITSKIPRLGGINLYNEAYRRGLQYYEVTDITNLEELTGKCRIKQSKRFKQDLLNSVAREIENKTDVQTDNVNDEINNFIRNYKENNKIGNCISYEKELSEIIDFFKSSELEAMNFLNKSPKNNNEYTEDYINRLNDMEKDIRVKENMEKYNILEKMKVLILKLKEKMVDIEKTFEEKNVKLREFERSLIKETSTSSTQTYDGYERKVKELQNTIKQTEEKYLIMTQLRKSQFNYEDKMYEFQNEIELKTSQLKKLMALTNEQEEELQYLKKIIRQNKQKLNLTTQVERKKPKNKTKLIKQLTSKKTIQQAKSTKTTQRIEQSAFQKAQAELKEIRQDKKAKKYQKFGTLSSSNGYRPSIEAEALLELDKQQYQQKLDIASNRRNDGPKKGSVFSVASNNRESQILESRDKKDSVFRPDNKKNVKKMSEQQKQVSFNVEYNKPVQISNLPIKQPIISQSSKVQDLVIKERSFENSRSFIDGQMNESGTIKERDGQDEGYTRRSNRKNTLKQKIDPNASSRSIEYLESKKSSKATSKKCIILKETSKQKNLITTILKLSNFSINQQYNLCIQTQQTTPKKNLSRQKINRSERPSYPFKMNPNDIQVNQDKTNNRMNNMYKELKNKMRSNNQSTYNLHGKGRGDSTGEEQFISSRSIKAGEENTNKRELGGNLIKKDIFNSTAVLKKSKKQPGKHRSKLEDTSSMNNFKRLASCLDQIKQASLQKGISLSEDKWRAFSDSMSEQNATIVNYIIDQIDKEGLNLDEFQEIMKIVDENGEKVEQQNQYNNKNEDCIKQSKVGHFFKEFSDNNAENDNKQMSKRFFISGSSLNRIQDLHKRIGKCQNKENNICEHLEKYIQILRKINEMSANMRLSLKLPIQKIGQNQFERKASNKAMKNTLTKIKPTKRLEQNSSDRANNLMKKTGQIDSANQDYVKQHINTDQYVDEKERILPIINSTTNNFYKGKAKLQK